MKLYLNKYLTSFLKGVYYKYRNKEVQYTERKVHTMKLKEAKNTLEANGYERKLVYRLTYQTDGTWKHIYFEDKEEADMVRARMMEVNKVIKIYRFISLNKCSWEIFIEPWRKGATSPLFIMWTNNKIEILFIYCVSI